MKHYTPDQLFDLLGTISCETDLIEIHHYVLSNWKEYKDYDVALFLVSIDILHEALMKPQRL